MTSMRNHRKYLANSILCGYQQRWVRISKVVEAQASSNRKMIDKSNLNKEPTVGVAFESLGRKSLSANAGRGNWRYSPLNSDAFRFGCVSIKWLMRATPGGTGTGSAGKQQSSWSWLKIYTYEGGLRSTKLGEVRAHCKRWIIFKSRHKYLFWFILAYILLSHFPTSSASNFPWGFSANRTSATGATDGRPMCAPCSLLIKHPRHLTQILNTRAREWTATN